MEEDIPSPNDLRDVPTLEPNYVETNQESTETVESSSELPTTSSAPVPELRRSERIRKASGNFSNFYNTIFEAVCKSEVDDVPVSYADIEKNASKHQWKLAVEEELNSMKTHDVWTIIEKPDKIKILKSRWVFRVKEDSLGNPIRFKARLVAKGFLQKPGVDYEDTYSPVAKYATVRTILAVGVAMQMYFEQLDVKTAFLYGDLKETIYLEIPDGMQAPPNTVLKLKKSLYGLKQSSRCWNTKVNQHLIKIGFKRSINDTCLYTKINPGHTLFLIIYVDDVLIAGESLADITNLKATISNVFEMSDSGSLAHFLSTTVEGK